MLNNLVDEEAGRQIIGLLNLPEARHFRADNKKAEPRPETKKWSTHFDQFVATHRPLKFAALYAYESRFGNQNEDGGRRDTTASRTRSIIIISQFILKRTANIPPPNARC